MVRGGIIIAVAPWMVLLVVLAALVGVGLFVLAAEAVRALRRQADPRPDPLTLDLGAPCPWPTPGEIERQQLDRLRRAGLL